MNLERWVLTLSTAPNSLSIRGVSFNGMGWNAATLTDPGTLYRIMQFVQKERLDCEPPAHEIILALFPESYRKMWENFFLNIAANVLQGSAGPPPKVAPGTVWTYSAVTLTPRTIKVEELPDE